MADALTGKAAKKQYALAAEAQAEQRRLIAEQERKVAAVEAGQRNLMAGGGGGLLAFIDKAAGDVPGVQPLKVKLGGQTTLAGAA